MYVGIARLEYHLWGARSLKAKRHVLRKLIDRARAKFKITVNEVDHQDLWQRITLGMAGALLTAIRQAHVLVRIEIVRLVASAAALSLAALGGLWWFTATSALVTIVAQISLEQLATVAAHIRRRLAPVYLAVPAFGTICVAAVLAARS